MKKITLLFMVFLLLSLFAIFLPSALSVHVVSMPALSVSGIEKVSENHAPATPSVSISHVETPSQVKGIYMTSWVASSPSLRNSLVKLIDETELNSIVIDVKDYSGKIVFPIEDNPALKAFGSEEIRVKDMPEFIESLHKKGIYVIARVAVFQDAYFVKHRPDLAVKNKAGTAVWKDRKGISWIDAGSREYWDYIALISEEAHKIGFDEINFDYIRFPSDGDMKDISFPWSSTTPKITVLGNFFSYLHDKLVSETYRGNASVNSPAATSPRSSSRRDLGDKGLTSESTPRGTLGDSPTLKISADLFGMVTTAEDDMGIGQMLESALPYFDYISPMVYPSHYPPTFMGFKEPEAHPYEVIKYAMQSAVDRREKMASTTGQTLAQFRPWLQDFGLRQTYTATDVRAQIKATYDTGLDSWLLWSASNKYTKTALEGN